MALPGRTSFWHFLTLGLMLALTGLPAYAQSSANLRLMPIGDSITSGFQSTTGNGYRGPLRDALAGQVGSVDFVGSLQDGKMADADHEGHSGYRIDQVAPLLTSALNTFRPNIVTLHIGTNDMNQSYQVSTAPARLAAMIDQIISAEPDATVVVAQLIPSTNPTTQANINAYNAQIPAIVQARANAGKHVYMVSMSAISTGNLYDSLHPNDTGYQLMANAWDAAIEQVLAAGWISDPVPGSAARPVGVIYLGTSGKCLDDYSGSATLGAKVDIWDCNSSASQQWDVNQGAVHINGLCLDVVGGGTANGTKVDLWSCSGGANQVWKPQNGALVNPASGRCLDDPGSSTVNGTQLGIWDCTGGANQQWQIPAQGSVLSGVSGKCLDNLTGSTANGNPVGVWDCINSAPQQWKITNGTVQFDGKCLDVVGGATANGTKVDLWACTGGANQVWKPQNGALVNPASGKCLDDPAFSTINGTQLVIWNCSGGSNQQWTLPQR